MLSVGPALIVYLPQDMTEPKQDIPEAKLDDQDKVEEEVSPPKGELTDDLDRASSYRENDLFLLDDFAKLLKAGEIDQAIELAWKITDYYAKSKALFDMFMVVLKSDNPEKALELADRGKEFNFFFYVFSQLKTPEKIRKALPQIICHIATKGPSNDWEKDLAWLEMSRGLMNMDMIDEAIEFANKIKDPSRNPMALQEICSKLIKLDDTDSFKPAQKALEVAGLITSCERKTRAVFTILEELTKRGDIENAFAAGVTILEKGKAFHQIFVNLMRMGGIDHVLEVVGKMVDKEERNWALHKIFKKLIEMKSFEEAFKVTRLMTDDLAKILAILYLNDAFLEIGDMDKVGEVLLLIVDNGHRDHLCANIAYGLISRQCPEDAKKIANMIQNPEVKGEILQRISNWGKAALDLPF